MWEVADVLVAPAADEVCPYLLAKDVLAEEDAVHAVGPCSRGARLVGEGEDELLVSGFEMLAVDAVVVVQLDVGLRNERSELRVSRHGDVALEGKAVSG